MSILAGIGGMAQGFMNMQSQRETNQANKELAQYSYSKDLEMWNRQNAYNDPSAQYERMKGSGVNPVAAFSKGSVQNTASQLPKYNTPTMQAPQMTGLNQMGALDQFQDVRLKQAQTNNVKTQTENQALQNFHQSLQNIIMGETYKTEIAGKKHDTQIKKWIDNQKRLAFETQNETRLGRVRSTNSLNKYNADLWDQKMNPNDPLWSRQLMKVFNNPKIQSFISKYL